jgi:type III pantothenate kinase
MLSAYQMAGQSCAVVSAGSAITADWLSDRGEHLGGFIVPGRKLLASTLLKDLANVLQQPLAVSQANLELGKSSEECSANGISVMLAGFINDIARRSQNAPIFLAGGDAKILYGLCDEVEKWRLTLVVNPVLDGLAIAMP